MALPKCPNQNCESHKKLRKAFFELKEENIGDTYKYFLVQCSTCGTVIGVLEYNNSGKLLIDQKNLINNLFQQYSIVNLDIINELNKQTNAIREIAEKIGLDNII